MLTEREAELLRHYERRRWNGDGWKWIERFNDDVQEDKANPRIEVTISEV